MTADFVVRHIERTCRTVIDGRRAARALAKWARRFELGDAEFQLLWCLRMAAGEGVDQTTLSKKLVVSPAQISSTVERAQAQRWICKAAVAGDRRRHVWRLAAEGDRLLDEMLAAAMALRYESEAPQLSDVPGNAPREAAA